METVLEHIHGTIIQHQLNNWLIEYPWLTGYLGNPNSAIWFIGENPSLKGVINVHNRSIDRNENLQWNSHDGDKLLREAITEAGLKTTSPEGNDKWSCYITNAIKEPEIVTERNIKKQKANYWKRQAERWQPTLQKQINEGKPKVLVLLGGQSEKIINHMIKNGLNSPATEKIHHYSYIMMRPEAGTRRGPRHPDRILQFKDSIKNIAFKYC
tara:strand:+ start:493 stop:1128 length:636 start_codon:yes stop_codon:yes gene_type:complete